MSTNIGLVSLGCSKNLVDSEQMLFLLDEAGYQLTADLDEADAVLVNTCGFIDDAKSEAIENILELCEIKKDKNSRLKAIVVTGCLSERYREQLYAELPEIDAIVGCSAHTQIAAAVQAARAGQKPLFFGEKDAPVAEVGRIPCMPTYSAYVRLSEGCDNRCAYCTIPSIRGPHRSRREEEVLAECQKLADDGAKELIIIAQDTTKFGTDLCGKSLLPDLLRKICAIDGVKWVRLHYANPDGITDELIDAIAENEKILRYLDIPIQHINTRILTAMNRHYTGEYVRELFAKLRARLPGLVLRTSLIVGFPGETVEDFEELCTFLREAKIERAGVFAFSPQEGTPAAEMDDQVDDEEKQRRVSLVTMLQGEIMDAYGEGLKGQTLEVLCEGYDRLSEVWFGRSYADSPDIDGKIFFKAAKGLAGEGQFCRVKITELMDGEPVGRALKPCKPKTTAGKSVKKNDNCQ